MRLLLPAGLMACLLLPMPAYAGHDHDRLVTGFVVGGILGATIAGSRTPVVIQPAPPVSWYPGEVIHYRPVPVYPHRHVYPAREYRHHRPHRHHHRHHRYGHRDWRPHR